MRAIVKIEGTIKHIEVSQEDLDQCFINVAYDCPQVWAIPSSPTKTSMYKVAKCIYKGISNNDIPVFEEV